MPWTSRNIYIHTSMSSMHEERFVMGVASYGREQSPIWTVRWGSELKSNAMLELHAVDGIFTFGLQSGHRDMLEAAGIPIVNFSSLNLPWDCVASVTPDNAMIGRMAAEYFLERVHENFAFVGLHSHNYSCERLEGYRSRLAGVKVSVFDASTNKAEDLQEALCQFLKALPRPAAVFCANDIFARRVCSIAREHDLAVPDDIAILGVDAEDLVSLSSPIALSSIDVDSIRMGRHAAALLHGIIEGLIARDTHELFPPKGVNSALSTDTMVTGDENLARALSFIRENAFRRLQIEEVCRASGIGRRTLERRFQAVLGKSMEAYIRQARVKRARYLLRESTLPIPEVAERCGFSSVFYFSHVFKKDVGVPPGAFRRS